MDKIISATALERAVSPQTFRFMKMTYGVDVAESLLYPIGEWVYERDDDNDRNPYRSSA